MVVLARVRHHEYHRNLWVELGDTLLLEVMGGVELEPVFAEVNATFGKLPYAAVGGGGAAADDGPAPVRPAMAQRDGHAFGGAAAPPPPPIESRKES